MISAPVAERSSGALTDEQLVAAGTRIRRVFLEAAPGSGKTTVAVHRFGVCRYLSSEMRTVGYDTRAVVAVSFTRSATRELRERVRKLWGPSGLAWPHRIGTLDALVYDLLRHLLSAGLVRWPGNRTSLVVHDTWKVLVEHEWTRTVAQVYLFTGTVEVRATYDAYGSRPVLSALADAVADGVCTHTDVRRVLEFALKDEAAYEALRSHLATTMRSLIVDEVFDANELDIRVIELALAAGVEVTLIGDPWQALYGFRGARPDLVPALLQQQQVDTLKLTGSFRWRTVEQAKLADDLRQGAPVALNTVTNDELRAGEVDVVLASVWDELWSASSKVLPIAWGSAKGNIVEAATTLLLNQSTSVLFAVTATYVVDALSTLGISEPELQRLELGLSGVLELVEAARTTSEWCNAYDALVSVIGLESSVIFPKAHWRYTSRLKLLQPRLKKAAEVVPGMTIHQAKGREWDVVACIFTDTEIGHLSKGLTSSNEKHRQLYVACTRARYSTRLVH